MARFHLYLPDAARPMVCVSRDHALTAARQHFGIETLAADEPEPKRDPRENTRWEVYNEADEGAFLELGVMIVEVRK